MLRVHIAPVGFEVDRIVLPAIDMKADRVWLITDDKPKEDEGSKFVKLIQRKLKEVRIECFEGEADRIDLFDILRVLRIIILRKKATRFSSMCLWEAKFRQSLR